MEKSGWRLAYDEFMQFHSDMHGKNPIEVDGVLKKILDTNP